MGRWSPFVSGTNVLPHLGHSRRSQSRRFNSSGSIRASQCGHIVASDARIFSRLVLLRGISHSILGSYAVDSICEPVTGNHALRKKNSFPRGQPTPGFPFCLSDGTPTRMSIRNFQFWKPNKRGFGWLVQRRNSAHL